MVNILLLLCTVGVGVSGQGDVWSGGKMLEAWQQRRGSNQDTQEPSFVLSPGTDRGVHLAASASGERRSIQRRLGVRVFPSPRSCVSRVRNAWTELVRLSQGEALPADCTTTYSDSCSSGQLFT